MQITVNKTGEIFLIFYNCAQATAHNKDELIWIIRTILDTGEYPRAITEEL